MSIASSIPHHLTSEILLRLPAESVVRSRYVSKLWSSITTDPYFTNTFETQCSTRPSLLVFFEKRGKLFVFSFPQQNQNWKESYSSQHVERYQMKYPKNCSFSFTESVHGLICFKQEANPIIWNPSMRQFLTLRKPRKKWKNITVFLGYDPIESKHKVVCLPFTETCDECRVLTLGSAQKSWRVIKTNHKHRTFSDSYGRCINGVVYYEAYIDHQIDDYMIMSFDVRTEKFHKIRVPSADFFHGNFIPYEGGRLACVDTMDTNGISLWILEDAEKHKWSCKYFSTPFRRSLLTIYRIDGITDTGEFIFVPHTFLKSFFIFYFDPVRNSLRKVEFKGIADDKFRFSHGLGSKRLGSKGLNALHIFPNHIQTLLSL